MPEHDELMRAAMWDHIDQVRQLEPGLWPAQVAEFLELLTNKLPEDQLDTLLADLEGRCKNRRALGRWGDSRKGAYQAPKDRKK